MIDEQNSIKVITQKEVTVANETARHIYAEGIGDMEGFNYLQYFVIHNKQPYLIGYKAPNNLYEKYLPDFQKMVKSFKWID